MGKVGNLKRLFRVAVLVGVAATLVGVPLAGSANPDISGFELDGNAASSGAADWNALGSPLDFTGFIDDGADDSDIGYGSGSNKDIDDVSTWSWKQDDVTPNKDDIVSAYAAVYAEQSNLVLYFGQTRLLDKNGDANVGFWFLQNEAGLNTDGSFSGSHADGDILVQSEFTNGGSVSGVKIFKWQGGSLTSVSNQAECTGGKLGTADACAIVNTGTISTDWAGDVTAPYFFEGGLNLSALFPQGVPCFSTFLTNTRTSQSESAELKDFAFGDIDTCGSIEITKVAQPSDSTEFDYSTTGALNPSTFKLTNGATRTYDKLTPGQYSVTEAAQTGSWAFDSLSCTKSDGSSADVNGQSASITLGFLGTVKCTYVNKRHPQVRVVKVTEPTTDTGKFHLQINGTTHASDVGHGGDTGWKEVPAGQSVTVGELGGTGTNLADYVSSVSCDSDKGGVDPGTSHSFTANFGDRVTCTITNRHKPEVKVVKVTNPTTDQGRFNLLVNGNVERANAMNGQDTGFEQVAAGAVTVGETAGTGTSLASYDSKVECDSNKGSTNPGTSHGFTANYGDKVTCTITNTRKSSLIVIKHVINDNGGSRSASDFPISVTGSEPNPASFAGAEAPGTSVAIGPGAYKVTETEHPDYAASYSAGCEGNLPAGGSATCTITNNDKPATLTVIKNVVNDNGGTASASSFTMTINGVTAQAGNSFPGAGAPGVTKTLTSLGSYNVTESAVPGYTQTSASADCSGTIALGESKTCTIVNDDLGAELIVKKVVVNDNGGTKGASDFSFQVNGGAAQAFEADGQNNLTVNAGTYKVVEPGVAGYTTSYNNCSNLVIALGGTATCTITNNDVPRGQGSISVSKSANPTTIKEPGGLVTFSVTITNTSADVDVAITNVVDDRFGDLDDSGGNGCFDVPINLAPGEKVNCTFTRQITGTGGTSHVNVVTASGTDENGNSLTASDDARVDITPRLIDLVIVKEASSPTPLNGIVNYSLTVTNKGPDTATNVQLADPAPAGITYLTANPSQGTCNLSPALITCSLGSIAAGQTVTIAITGRATAVGSHTNTATVTGGGGRETNPADNVDSAVTVVPAPLKPPTVKPEPTPEVCLTLTVSPKMIKADGKPDKVRALVTAGKKRVKGVKVSVSGAGVSKSARTNGKGVAVLRINPRKPGIITVTVVESNQKLCGPKRIGVVGVFLPPLTG